MKKTNNTGQIQGWAGYAVVLAVAPLLFYKGASLSILSQMGIMIIFALSYNMLLGQGGMLSFGHAVYAGLGAFFAIHTMNLTTDHVINIPVSLIPLVGGCAGLLFGYIRIVPPETSFTLGTDRNVSAGAPRLSSPAGKVLSAEVPIAGNFILAVIPSTGIG